MLCGLDRHLLQSSYGQHFRPYPNGPASLWVRDLSDNWYPAPEGEDKHFGIFEGIYVLDYLPMELFSDVANVNILSDPLRDLLKRIKADYESRVVLDNLKPTFVPVLEALYFINNLSGFTEEQNLQILDKYEKAVHEVGILFGGHVLMGNIDTFLMNQPRKTTTALHQFLAGHDEGVSIDLNVAGPSVQRIQIDKYLSSGVTSQSQSPYEPVFLRMQQEQDEAIHEFEDLLKKGTKEDRLEAFLKDHYRDIFGPEYDRVETQLWLRFPELDIAAKNRRLDIFLRNGVFNDWELFEVKRYVPLSGTYRDCPVLAAEVHHAIQQVKNYRRLLSQEVVKRALAKEGIEYFEPSLRLVIGQRPQVSHEQWCWLLRTNESEVKIITYDDLLEEMKRRLNEKLEVIELALPHS